MPYKAQVQRHERCPRQKLFDALMDFGAIARLDPEHIATCRVEGEGVGAIRRFTLVGNPEELAERLECAFDGRVFSYSVITPNSLGLEYYHAVVMLEDAADGGCDVTWGSNWFSRNVPDAEMVPLLNAMYVNLIDAMAAG
ncbi:MAG: SRPBCC family protein [Gammaproteobacteria bacterium]